MNKISLSLAGLVGLVLAQATPAFAQDQTLIVNDSSCATMFGSHYYHKYNNVCTNGWQDQTLLVTDTACQVMFGEDYRHLTGNVCTNDRYCR